MKERLQHLLSIPVCLFALASIILVSGCVLSIDGSGSATLTPSSSSAIPAPAGLYLDPPAPGATSPDVVQPPLLPEPAARIPYADPAFGTRIVRVTDHAADIAQGDTSAGLKNEHSQAQAFNADGSRFLIQGTAGSWYLYNATTLLPEGRLPFDGAVESRWDVTRPDLLYYIDGPRFMRYNISAQERTTVHDFSGEFSPHAPTHVWANDEYGPSEDGRSWALLAQGGMGKTFAFLIYDPIADQVVARRDITPTEEAINVAISPLGNYFLAFFPQLTSTRSGTDASPGGVMIYGRDLKNGHCLVPYAGDGSDLALDMQGREVLVYLDSGNDTLAMCDLATGVITPLMPVDSPGTMQISGRAIGMPGWALVSTGGRVLAVELKQGGLVVGLAWQNLPDPSRATVDRNFTRVLFATSWGRMDTGAFDTYLIVLPQGWAEKIK